MVKRKRWIDLVAVWLGLLGVLFVLLLAGPGGQTVPGSEAVLAQELSAVGESGVELVESDGQGVVFRLALGGYRFDKTVIEGKAYDVLQAEGLPMSAEWGSPQVPVDSVMLGIPLSADLKVNVVEGDCKVLDGAYRLPPVPRPVWSEDRDLGPEGVPGEPGTGFGGGALTYLEDAAVYARDTFHPAGLAEVSSVGFLRNQRVATIAASPFQYNPVSGQVRVCEDLTVEVNFALAEGDTTEAMGSWESAGAFESVLEGTILNYKSAQEWRGAEVGRPIRLTAPEQAGTYYKVLVEQDGIYRLTAGELAAAGLPVGTIDPLSYQMFYQGGEIPIKVVESGDTLDYLLFYGQKANNEFTNTNVYWLTYGLAQGARMLPKSAPPSATVPVAAYAARSVHLEEDHYYRSVMPWRAGGDHWWWSYTYLPTSVLSWTVEMELTPYLAEAYSGTLRTYLHGWTSYSTANPDHCLQVYLNDQPLLAPELTFDGRVEMEPVVGFDGSLLVPGTNTVRWEGCATDASYDIVFYNWLELEYRDLFETLNDSYDFEVGEAGWQYEIDGFTGTDVEVFDISDAYNTSYLTDHEVASSAGGYAVKFHDGGAGVGSQYLAIRSTQFKTVAGIAQDSPSTLSNPANQADYVMLVPQALMAEALPLAQQRANQGLTTMVVDIEDIYDEFNFGVYDPDAIRDFLAHAYHFWTPPRPTYVLLVGVGHYDFKDNLATGAPNWIPPYMAFVDPWKGESAAENRYVSVAGDDVLPDMVLGRLPVENATQLAAMVSKILAYENSPPSGDWTQRVLLAADNTDSGGDFAALSDDLVNFHLPAPYIPQKVYLGDTCAYQNPSVECKQQVLDTLNGPGALVVNFIGHAGRLQWAGEKLLHVDDIPALVPNDKVPVMLVMGCLEGNFEEPEGSTLAEANVLAVGKGAVASWSPSGLGVAVGHDYLNKGFFDAVFSSGVREVGLAALEGKIRVFNRGAFYDLIETYNLFGDPAMRINALSTDVQLEKVVEPAGEVNMGDVVTYTLTFTNVGPETAYQVLVTDVLPPALISPTVFYSSTAVLSEELTGLDYTWTVSDLLPHTGGEIRLRAVVSTTTGPNLAVNVAGIHSDTDVDHSNNVMSTTTQIRMPDPVIVKTGPVDADNSTTITYTIVYSNDGQTPALEVRLVDELPLGVSYKSDDSGLPHSEPVSGTHVWDVGGLGAGIRDTFQLVVEVGAQSATGPDLTNTAWIESATPDGEAGNSESVWLTSIRYPFLIYLPVVLRD